MTLDISAQERRTVHCIGIPASAPFSEFGAPGGPNEMVPRIFQWLAEHGIAPQSGPLYIYRRMESSEPVELTVAVPVAEPVKPTSGLVAGSLPAGTYVVGRHLGAPDRIPASRAQMREWAQAHGHRLDVLRDERGTPWTGYAEHFLTDPAEEPDPSKWTTELLFKTV